MYGFPGIQPQPRRLAEHSRTATKAGIKRGSKRARTNLQALDRVLLVQVEQIYKNAVRDIGAYLRSRAADDNTLRLEVMRSLIDQAEARLNILAAERNGLMDEGLRQAAGYGVEPFAGVPEIGASLSAISDDAVRFVVGFVAEDGLQLSDRIWALDNHAREVVSSEIQRAVVQGHSASQAARNLLARGLNIPPELARKMTAAQWDKIYREIDNGLFSGEGSAYSNARRVMRTEINRAHGQAYQAAAFDHPDVIGTRFLLSPRHPRTDICDMHARVNRYGLGPGVYPEGKNPWPAHPNTLSFTEVVFRDEVSESDRQGKENRIDWLKRQDPATQAQILSSRAKQQALRQGVLREGEINTPWRVLKKKYLRRGIDISGAVPGSQPPGPGAVIDDDGIIIKTKVPGDFPAAETMTQAGKIGRQYVTQGRAYQYLKNAHGEYLVRFRHGPKYRPDHVRTKKYNKLSYSGLKVETANAVNRGLHEVDQVAEKLGLPALRGVNTAAGKAAASMGDGILAVSKYNNRYFEKQISKPEAIQLYQGQIKSKQKAIERVTESPSYSENSRKRVIAGYQQDVENIKGKIKQLNDGVPVEVVQNPPSKWTPGSNEPKPFTTDAYFPFPADKFKTTIWHEFGHHIHQQLNVKNGNDFLRPPLEMKLEELYGKTGKIFPTRYSATNPKEWFAESYSLYRMGRSDLVDQNLLQLIRQIEKGEFHD